MKMTIISLRETMTNNKILSLEMNKIHTQLLKRGNRMAQLKIICVCIVNIENNFT